MAKFVTKICQCGAEFRTSNDSALCYHCTLADLTGGLAPEEADFNTAAIWSGTMTAQERRWLQQDLAAVESGRSGSDAGYYPPVYPYDYGYCEGCGFVLDDCICSELVVCPECGTTVFYQSHCSCCGTPLDQDEEEEDPRVLVTLWAACSRASCRWYSCKGFYASDPSSREAAEAKLKTEHATECDCAGELGFAD